MWQHSGENKYLITYGLLPRKEKVYSFYGKIILRERHSTKKKLK